MSVPLCCQDMTTVGTEKPTCAMSMSISNSVMPQRNGGLRLVRSSIKECTEASVLAQRQVPDDETRCVLW